jgi:hypothetical protein
MRETVATETPAARATVASDTISPTGCPVFAVIARPRPSTGITGAGSRRLLPRHAANEAG